ncbi:MAG TPA: hypothetical protein DIT13_01505 [Verrucomicrobiales bacterium]|nr:hypothetical protein [Verrucomicrobiales bacterium]HRJ08349.1 hypothetical protein [Prosthecobacter sp.]HRK16238.1 hypothetical protein [Prosthecobacter sp.]
MPAPSRTPYAQFQAELEQIMLHKWLASESEGKDIGFERALNDWALNHRAAWRREQNNGQKPAPARKG